MPPVHPISKRALPRRLRSSLALAALVPGQRTRVVGYLDIERLAASGRFHDEVRLSAQKSGDQDSEEKGCRQPRAS